MVFAIFAFFVIFVIFVIISLGFSYEVEFRIDVLIVLHKDP